MPRSLRGFVAALLVPVAVPSIAWADRPGDDGLTDPWRAEGEEVLSTSGTAISRSPPPPPPPAPSDVDARIAALEKRLAELERERASAEKRSRALVDMIEIGGFAQPQLVVAWFDAGSTPNRAPDGSLVPFVPPNVPVPTASGETNATTFRMRRARPRLDFAPFDFARLVVEVELSGKLPGVPGSQIVARQIEAQGLVRWTRDLSTTFAAGVMRVPFGHETLEAETARPFVERSFVQQSLFPGEFDIGARVDAQAWEEKVKLQVAVVNGLTVGEIGFSGLPDLDRSKDVAWRVHGDLGPLGLGASGYAGTGRLVDAGAWISKDYLRWAAGLEGQLHGALFPRLGESRLLGEVIVSRNMDRGTFYPFARPGLPANLASGVIHRDELGFVVRLEQDASRWITTGLRVDGYSPETTVQDNWRLGYAFVGVVHFTRNLQLMLEYGVARDTIRPAGVAVAPRWTVTSSTILQAAF
jgi:hypothetical protein